MFGQDAQDTSGRAVWEVLEQKGAIGDPGIAASPPAAADEIKTTTVIGPTEKGEDDHTAYYLNWVHRSRVPFAELGTETWHELRKEAATVLQNFHRTRISGDQGASSDHSDDNLVCCKCGGEILDQLSGGNSGDACHTCGAVHHAKCLQELQDERGALSVCSSCANSLISSHRAWPAAAEQASEHSGDHPQVEANAATEACST